MARISMTRFAGGASGAALLSPPVRLARPPRHNEARRRILFWRERDADALSCQYYGQRFTTRSGIGVCQHTSPLDGVLDRYSPGFCAITSIAQTRARAISTAKSLSHHNSAMDATVSIGTVPGWWDVHHLAGITSPWMEHAVDTTNVST